MFSSRTGWNRVPNPLADAVARHRAAGRPLLDLTETNPTRAGLRAPADALAGLAGAAALEYAPQPFGRADAREAVAADFARRGVSVTADRVLLTASTSEAYAYAFKLLCDPGDEVLVPRPSYPLFEYLAELESVRVRTYPLDYDGQWHLLAGRVDEAVTPRTRAIVVVSPNNPTGSYLKQDEAEALRAVCLGRGLALVSDEVFADFALREDTRRVGSVFTDAGPLALSLGGLSKSCGLPQLKLGWLAVAGPAAAREEALARLEIVADTYLSVGTPVQVAAAGLLARLPGLQAPIAARIRTNLDALRAAVAPDAPVTLLDLEGGWSAVLRVPSTRTEEDWVAVLLDEDGVLVHPGFFFDFPREAFVVLSLLPEPAVFAEGVARLAARIARTA